MVAVYRLFAASETVATNIVVFELDGTKLNATELVAAAKSRSILINALGPTKMRLLTHLDVSRAQCEQAAETLVQLLS